MPLYIYDGGANSIATQLLTICAGAPITITAVNTPPDGPGSLVTYPTSHDPNLEANPPIGRKMVFALANSSIRISIWSIMCDEGLPTSISGTRLTEEADAALVHFDQYPNLLYVSISYYSAIGDDGPFFTVTVHQNLGTGLNTRTENESPLLMLVHLLAHAYLLITGKHDPATSEDQALNLENIYRNQHFLAMRVDSHIERPAVYDLGGCGC